jgi:SAM-dependent methyltransferase
MSDDRVEKQVREFYDNEGWVPNSAGKTAEDILFRDLKGDRGAYGEKTGLQPYRLLEGHSGTLLIVGGGDLPVGHMRATEGFKKVVCIDISQRALELSKKKLGDKGKYYKASARYIPLSDNSVDAVLCSHMLYHVDRANQETAVNEMIRVTKSGGKILIIYANPNAPLMLIQRFLKVLRINRLLGKAKLYVYNHPTKWWKNFSNRCVVTILPNDAISTNQARVLLPTIGLRRYFFRWAAKLEDMHPDLAVKLWSYVMVMLNKSDY